MGQTVYEGIAAASALIPAILLLAYVYKEDRVEKEPPLLLLLLLIGGVCAAGVSYILESLAEFVPTVMYYVTRVELVYSVTMALMVAVIEEGTKYCALKTISWKNKAFDYRFDGIVYAVFVSLGFAAVENVAYVFTGGISTALVRAVSSLPGHTAFAVIMGIYYGRAKMYSARGNVRLEKKLKRKAFGMAVLYHTMFDATLFVGTDPALIVFIFVLINVYRLVFKRVKQEAFMDETIQAQV